MSRRRRLIIPVFIPFGGCPNQCVFCDQRGMTGQGPMPSAAEVRGTTEKYLSTWKGGGTREIAFYGGSFTGLPEAAQVAYLEAARSFVREGRIDSIRVSTRPDYIDGRAVAVLREYGVATVELGAQSMSDEVLRLSGRGHGASATRDAVAMLREAGLDVGLQFMPGLPGDTQETIIATTMALISLRPDFVRVYPAVVLKDTPLFSMYRLGQYRPWTLDDMVKVCARVLGLLEAAGIPVARMGLQATPGLAGSIAAGPYHPSFRQLVEQGRAVTAPQAETLAISE